MGSAADQIRAQLAALMGTDDTASSEMEFSDPKVCRSFLCGGCPNDLVENTKLDMGECDKIHSVGLRKQYQDHVKSGRAGYEAEWYRHLSEFTQECDRKAKKAEARLSQTQEMDTELMDKGLKVQMMVQAITEKGIAADKCEAEGNPDEAAKLRAEIDAERKIQLAAAAAFKEQLPPGNLQQQSLRVCVVCSCMLSIVDNDERLADHFRGKQHLAMQSIRAHVAEMEKSGKCYDRPRGRDDGGRDRDRDRRDRSRERERRDSNRDRRDRSRERDRRDSGRDRDRDRDRDRRSSRDDRDRSRRDRSRSRDRRDRDRDRR